MRDYVLSLLNSRLPFEPWVVIATWLVLFFANHVVARKLRAMNAAQSLISVENQDKLIRGSQPHWMLAQLLFGGVIFALTLFLDRALFVFLGGGLVVAVVCTLSLNAQSILSARALQRPGASQGKLTLSTDYAYRQMASRLGCSGAMCAALGLLLAHLSLFGGALLLSSAAVGYQRRASVQRGQSNGKEHQ